MTPEILALIRDLYDPTDCWYDHHGYCQAHGWLAAGRCPHARARDLLLADPGTPICPNHDDDQICPECTA